MAVRHVPLEFENISGISPRRQPYGDSCPVLTSGLARTAGRICTSGAFIEQSDFVFNGGVAKRFCSSRGSNEIPSQNEGVVLIVKNLLGMSGVNFSWS
jgi:hypothetical protein